MHVPEISDQKRARPGRRSPTRLPVLTHIARKCPSECSVRVLCVTGSSVPIENTSLSACAKYAYCVDACALRITSTDSISDFLCFSVLFVPKQLLCSVAAFVLYRICTCFELKVQRWLSVGAQRDRAGEERVECRDAFLDEYCTVCVCDHESSSSECIDLDSGTVCASLSVFGSLCSTDATLNFMAS